MKARLSLLLLVLVVACDKDKDNVAPENELWMYADKFYEEAAARNITLDKSKLTIRFVEASEIAPYAGYGTTTPTPLVRIVKARWDTFTDMGKEILMFHELGHAVLRRIHTNEILPDCLSYKSMMDDTRASIQLSVYTPATIERRQYYIDELFDPYTPYPAWAALPPIKTNIPLDMTAATFLQFGGSTHTGNVEDDGSFHIFGANPGIGNSYWYLPVPSQDFPIESTVAVTFKMKTLAINGQGGFVRVDVAPDYVLKFTTSTLYYQTVLQGTTDYQSYALKLNCYPTDNPALFVYLTLDGAAVGDVWFKDITVDYYK